MNRRARLQERALVKAHETAMRAHKVSRTKRDLDDALAAAGPVDELGGRLIP